MWIFLFIGIAISYPCKFSLDDGAEYDLSIFTRDIPDYEADNVDYIYRFNICQNSLKQCGGSEGIATQWRYNGECVAITGRQEPKSPDLVKIEDGIALTYYNGDNCIGVERKTVYKFHCSPNDLKVRIGLIEDVVEYCVYSFDIYSKDACFGNEEIYQSYAYIIYGILFLVLVYFIFGFLYNKYNDKELEIIEAIPHGEACSEFFGRTFNKFKQSFR